MVRLCIGLIFCFWVSAASAQNNDFPERETPSKDKLAGTLSDGIQPSQEDMKIIAVMEILELMDLVEEMDMVQDLDYLVEEDQNEN